MYFKQSILNTLTRKYLQESPANATVSAR